MAIIPFRITVANWETPDSTVSHHWYFYQFFRWEVLAILLAAWIGKAGAKK
jgi:hypothetical protein